MSSDACASNPSTRPYKFFAWSPILCVASDAANSSFEVVGKRRLAIQVTKNNAAALAREACYRHAEAIGFTVEHALIAVEVDHA